MSVSILSLRRRDDSARRHSNRCPIGVESMEGRALLASAAVTSAIFMVEQAQLDLHREIGSEVTILKSNILTIEDATSTFIYNARSDILSQKQDELANPANAAADKAAIAADQLNIKNATRDEKFAIGQQNQLIRQLVKLGKQGDSTANSEIKGLNRGKIDPANVPTDISNFSDMIQTSITNIDTQATTDLNGLTSTLASGTA